MSRAARHMRMMVQRNFTTMSQSEVLESLKSKRDAPLRPGAQGKARAALSHFVKSSLTSETRAKTSVLPLFLPGGSSSPHSRRRAVLRDGGCRSVRAHRLRRGSVRAAGGGCLCRWRCRGTLLWRVNVSETQRAALLCLCRSRRPSALLSSAHRPQRPAAHLPLKGRGTDFQVANAPSCQ